MRDSNRSALRGRGRLIVGRGRLTAVALGLGVALAGCGSDSAIPTPSPTPAPVSAPTVTPDPHLVVPTTIDAVYRGLQEAGLTMRPMTSVDGGSREPRRSISFDYQGWPLIISEFSTAKALASATKWKAGAKPGQGEAPVAIKGLNILVEWGPMTGAKPLTPTTTQAAAATALVAALDPLLYPLTARTKTPLVMPLHTPVPTSSPSPSVGASASIGPSGSEGPGPSVAPTP